MGKEDGPGRPVTCQRIALNSGTGLMAKDKSKSEKKKKHVSDAVLAPVEEDVEMAETKVSDDYSCSSGLKYIGPRLSSR